MSFLERLRALASRHPRVLRFLFVGGVLAAVAVPLSRVVPRDTEIVYDLGAAHGAYRVLRLAYVPRGQAQARVLTERFEQGAPRQYRHHVELPRGPYEIHARLEGPDETLDLVRFVELGRSERIDVSLENVNPFRRTSVEVDR